MVSRVAMSTEGGEVLKTSGVVLRLMRGAWACAASTRCRSARSSWRPANAGTHAHSAVSTMTSTARQASNGRSPRVSLRISRRVTAAPGLTGRVTAVLVSTVRPLRSRLIPWVVSTPRRLPEGWVTVRPLRSCSGLMGRFNTVSV